MIDTHCHLTFPEFRNRVPEVLDRARAAGVDGVITVSTTSDDALAALEIATAHERVWCTAGVHPLYADRPAEWADLVEVARQEKCVAWGELGMDYHYDDPPRAQQRLVLAEQLEVIEKSALPKPIVVHCREAFADLLDVFRRAQLPPDRFVFHCFTGTIDEAKAVLDFGAWISFTGIVTFANAREIQEAARIVPDDRIMIETDSPYLTPEPHRKVRPNEPRFAADTARFVAQLRDQPWEEFESMINRNVKAFFGIA